MKINNIADKKISSHTVKPLFSNEINDRLSLWLIKVLLCLMMIITFVDKGLLYLMIKKLWKHSINVFLILRTISSLAVNPFIKKPSVELFTVPVKRASEEYKKHPSIVYVTNKMTSVDNPKFKLRFFPQNETFFWRN